MKRLLGASLFFAALVILWEILVRREIWAPYIVPSPLEVIGLLADKIMFSPFERFLHRRWGTGRV